MNQKVLSREGSHHMRASASQVCVTLSEQTALLASRNRKAFLCFENSHGASR